MMRSLVFKVICGNSHFAAFRETYPSLAHGVGVIVAAVRKVSWLDPIL